MNRFIKKNIEYRFLKINNRSWATIFFYFIVLNVHSQDNISFQKVGLKNGLSQVSVLAIHQDNLNRMWFGTRNGLNCWDGIQMKQFYPEPEDSASLHGYNIGKIIQHGNFLWLLSKAGELSSLNLETFTFKKYLLDYITSIALYKDSVLIASKNDIWTFNPQKDKFNRNPEIYEGAKAFTNIYQDNNGVLWIADELNNQIIRIEDDKKEVIKLPVSGNLTVFDLLVDSYNKLWIATRYNGLLVYNNSTKTFETINKNSYPFYLKDITVRDLVEDNAGRIWAGTFNGLAVFDLHKNTTSFINASENNENSLSHNSVHCIYLSNDGNIWIGTYFGGANYGKISDRIFTKYNLSATNQKHIYPVIGPIIEDNDGHIWIGTEGNGLYFFNCKKYTFTNYGQPNSSDGHSQTNIKSLYLSRNNYLFVGTFQGGLYILDLKTKGFKHYNNNIKNVNSIIPYENGFLLATEKGVKRFNPENESFTDFLSSEKYGEVVNSMIVKELFQDSKGLVWIGTEYDGIRTYDPKTGELIIYQSSIKDNNSLSSNSINCIMEDHLFRVWIGTNYGGLNLYDRKRDNFTSFSKSKNNLPSDFVYGLTESRFGNLWVATSKGLSRFDVNNNLFINYESESGFPLEELNFKALLETHKGEMFVGGIDGLISFKEEDLLLNKANCEIIFSTLEVNNREVRSNDKSKILSSDISTTKSFTLKPEHSVFKICYSACNYNPELKNKYQYELEGFDNDWVNAKYNTSVTYTNLNPGKYIFKVRGTNVKYDPITKEKSIEIIVKPPLSRTWYACTFYVLVFLAILLLFNYFYLGKARMLYLLKNERKEKNLIKELSQNKFQFFTNISHEFMTPLTIIISSVEQIISKNKIPGDLKHPLLQIFRNSKRLKNLNSELLDFRKIEQGHLKLKIQENDIVPYLEEIFYAFSGIAQEKNINYSFEKNADHVLVWYDSIQMDKVFYNLLSNAFNHVALEKGEVKIILDNKIDQLTVSISDNGEGIPEEEIEKVFNRFFHFDTKISQKEYYGSGIGLALSQSIVKEHQGEISCKSELNIGSTFTVSLQKGHNHFNPELISDKKIESQFSMDKDLLYGPEILTITNSNETKELSVTEAPLLLIVDDNSEIRSIIKNLFIDKYQIELANDGKEGLNKALELQPDIIIADVKLPHLSGFEMCEKLKRNIITSHIPIALVTVLGSEEDHVAGFKCGADCYITKPFNSESLVARIENLFNTRKLLQNKFNQELSLPIKSMSKNRIDQVFLEKALYSVEKHIMDSDFSVVNFALEMGIGRTLFFRKIKMITGQTPNDFVQTIRLKKAADILLTDPNQNISEIAYEVGFCSPRYFSRCFKNHFGVVPSKYGKTKQE